MKRIICVFLAAVFVAALGFTQELKFDGYVNGGLGLWMGNDVSGYDDPMIMAFGVDSERNLGRFRLNGSYTNEAKTAGVNFRLQVQGRGVGGIGSASVPLLTVGYGWVKLLDMITVKAGIVDDSTWQTADFIYNDDQSEGVGVLVRITPIAGLDIGAGGFLATPDSSSNNNYLAQLGATPKKAEDAKYTLNVAYTMDKVFRIMASFRPDNKTLGDGSGSAPKNLGKYNRSQILAEFRLLAVDGLTAIIVGQMDNLDDKALNKDINIYETFGYKLGALGVGLNAAQYIRNLPSGSTASDELSLWFNPWVSYAFSEGKIVPRLDVVYFRSGRLKNDSGTPNDYSRRGFEASYIKDSYVLNARPSLKINVDSRTSFEIGDSFYYSKAKGADAAMINVVYTDIVVKF